jgi:hypothetical protein
MEAYSSESSPPNPIPKLPMTPAPPVVGHHRAATGLGGLPQLCVGGKANLTLQASHAAGDMAEYAPLLTILNVYADAAVTAIIRVSVLHA